MTTDAFDARGQRVWLIDLAERLAPIDLLSFRAYSGGFSAARDGRSFVVGAGDKWNQAIYLGDTMTGQLKELVRGGVSARPSYPRISPDGSHLAWLESADRWLVTIWGGPLPDGPFVPLVVHHGDARFGSDIAWSSDARFLSYTLDGRLQVVDLRDGTVFGLGGSSYASWAPGRHLLAFSGPAYQMGARYLTLFDADTRTFRDLFHATEGAVGEPLWNDRGDKLLVSEIDKNPPYPSPPLSLVVRDLAGLTQSQPVTSWNGPLWWSNAERPIALRYGESDGITPKVVPLIDLASGHVLALFCNHGGAPPSACAGP